MKQYQNYSYVEEILDTMKISANTLYNDIGISRQSWSGYKASGKIPLEQALKVKEWISKYISERAVPIEKEDGAIETSDNTISVKFYDMSVSAGVGFDVDSIHETPFSEMNIDRSLIPSNMLSSDICAMKVDGKSMVPTILPNEIVIYKEETGRYSGDALYIVNFGGMLMVKRIQFNPENGKYDIVADNKEFKSYCVDIKDDQTTFIIIGKVIATIQQ